ncbi:hypothetical protein FOZG_18539 [Fusarium oxysporum Fo47]|uniref:Uncharacterized protein n=1 Tax=Fusarium oxysporum Fo47 TaxID=660027 RepID=W9JDL5_FUSOX|nr:hypothetical protein FOZG_18539 [Fusarium oxysporum Fo47]
MRLTAPVNGAMISGQTTKPWAKSARDILECRSWLSQPPRHRPSSSTSGTISEWTTVKRSHKASIVQIYTTRFAERQRMPNVWTRSRR